MKSSKQDLLAFALALLALLAIGLERGGLASDYKTIKVRSDAYVLPSIDQTYVASLGYRSAVADLIFGHVLVAYGLHFQERRLFEHVGDYLDVINRLDPKFRDPYRVADTLLTLQPKAPPVDFYRKARQIQERGLKELPNDQELWATAGQFITYLAAGQVPTLEEKREYQEAGTRYLMHACELIGSNDRIPYHCITAATVLSREGNREALRGFLERLQTVSDDPTIQALAANYLSQTIGEGAQAEIAARNERYLQKWHTDLPSSPRAEIGSLGPRFDPASCAGRERALAGECATSWRAWDEAAAAVSAP